MFFHVLSFSFIFFHVLSCSFMFFHVLSFSFIFFRFLSFSFIFFHFLSCSFIFFHFLLFYFIFLLFFHFLSCSSFFDIFFHFLSCSCIFLGDQPLRRDRDDDELWNSHDLHNRGIGHLVEEELGNPCGPTCSLDHGESASAPRQGKSARPANRGIDHLVEEELGNPCGPTCSLDHGNRPLHHDKKINDLDELQLRNFHSFLHGTTYRSFWSIPATMRSICGLKKTGRNTARGAIQAKPARCPLVHTGRARTIP